MDQEQMIAWVSTLDRDTAIQKWRDAQVALANAKVYEQALRMKIVQLGFPAEFAAMNSSEGTKNLELGGGWKLQAVFKQNYNLPNFDIVQKTLTAIRELGTNEAQAAYERTVKFKPELAIGEYKKTGGEPRKLLDAIVTMKPGLTEVKLIEPAHLKGQ